MYIFENLIKMNTMTHLQSITYNFGGPTISKSKDSFLRNSEQIIIIIGAFFFLSYAFLFSDVLDETILFL